MSMNVEAEIRDLKPRVGELEGSFGFLTEQVKGVHKDLLAFEAKTEQHFEKVDQRFDKIDGKLDKIDGKVDRFDGRLDHVETGLRGLRTDMPKIVGETLREVLREQRGKS
jgi:predicted  nucleic acid-binding Zn-ribbon protein